MAYGFYTFKELLIIDFKWILEAGFVIENTKNNISGAAIQWRTFPTPLEESCPRWQGGEQTHGCLHLPDGECFRWGKRILFVL